MSGTHKRIYGRTKSMTSVRLPPRAAFMLEGEGCIRGNNDRVIVQLAHTAKYISSQLSQCKYEHESLFLSGFAHAERYGKTTFNNCLLTLCSYFHSNAKTVLIKWTADINWTKHLEPAHIFSYYTRAKLSHTPPGGVTWTRDELWRFVPN